MPRFSFDTRQRPPGAERFRLIETMRWQDGAVQHRKRHAERLARSARYFGFAFSAEAFRKKLREAAAAIAPDRPPRDDPPYAKLRLTLGAGGDLRASSAPLGADDGAPLCLTVAEERTDSSDPFFRHKTTWRRVYRRAFEAAQAAGFDDALLVNERGEVTEATRANLVLEMDGTLVTPPVRCGLLPGIGRMAWLEEAGVAERVIRLEDVQAAGRWWTVSALRGRRRAVLGGPAETKP